VAAYIIVSVCVIALISASILSNLICTCVECQIHFLIENTIIILDLLDPCLRRSSLEILYILQFIFS